MPHIRVVTKPEQVLQNIRTFQKELETTGKNNDLVNTLSHFRAWYAVKANGKWIFGPSKFVGYVDLTAKAYATNTVQLDGRKTEDALKPWFVEVSSGPLYDELNDKLHDFLASFGKQPSSLARVSICREGLSGADEEFKGAFSLVEALLTIYREMPEAAQQEFRRRIKKEA